MVPEQANPVRSSRPQAVVAWGLEANDKGHPHPSVANVVRILRGDENLAGGIWFDEFLDRICTVWPTGDVREWTDADDVRLQVYIQEGLSMPKLGKQAVQDAVMLVARMDTRNEAAAYLETLRWDGVERIPAFFPAIFGTEDTEYTRAVGASFWLSLVARVTQPGCKVDTMVVLEGLQGAGKSRALSIIGGRWFAEATQAPTDKDFYLNLAGKMLVEIGEMDAFNRSEVTKVKQVITCQVDRYRAPYERRAADHPRRCVFAGTTNRDDWNKDETGARRFLPILVGEVRHDLLAQQRDHLFAEALARLKRGENWWTLPAEETLAQQEARRDSDELEARLADWLIGRGEIMVADVLDEFMKVPLERQDKSIQMRVAKALRVIGWQRRTVRRGSRIMKVWTRGGNAPQSDSAWSSSQHPEDGPF
jgi:predicted P-loop ATPase